jgi:hypothetical protein
MGLFSPIQAMSSNHCVAGEFEKLESMCRRTWVSERKAKEAKVLILLLCSRRASLRASVLFFSPLIFEGLIPDVDRASTVVGGVGATVSHGEGEVGCGVQGAGPSEVRPCWWVRVWV